MLLVFYDDFPIVYKKAQVILWRYAHSGIRVWRKITKNVKFEKIPLSLKNSSPDSKSDFSKKIYLVFGG